MHEEEKHGRFVLEISSGSSSALILGGFYFAHMFSRDSFLLLQLPLSAAIFLYATLKEPRYQRLSADWDGSAAG